MRTVSLRLADLERSTIPIGFQGENLHTQVRIDCKMIYKDYPAAVVSLAVTPPQGDPYPVMVIRDGDIVAWNVTASDTAYHGDGRVQFTFVDGEEVIKTVRGKTSIAESDEPSGTAPTPIQNWITIANVVLDEVAHAVEAALHAPIIDDNGYWAIWDADAEEYVATEYKAQGTDGHDGVGIVSIEKTGTSGLVDTYTITFTSGNPVTYTVTNGRDGNDGISPTATVTKSGKVATITITDKNGTTSETVSDGADADPAALIDDTAGSGATGKTWSADKLAAENLSLLTEIMQTGAYYIDRNLFKNPTSVNSNASNVINAAIIDAQTKGLQYCVIPEGEYWITQTIYLKSDVILRGCGIDATTLKIADGCDIDAIRVAEPVNNSGLMDLAIDGNRIENYSVFVNGHHGNAINVWLHYGRIERVRTNWVFKHSLLLNYDTRNSDDGLGFAPEHQNDMGNLNKVLWCDFKDSLLQGVMWGWRTMDSWMCYTNIGSHAANLYLEGGTSRFIGNHFDGDGDNGSGPEYNIYCGDGCNAMVFEGNIFENTQKENIFFRQPSYSNQTMTITIANNIIRTCSKSQNEQYANIKISGYSSSVPATEIIISGNQILNPDTNANHGYAGIHLLYCENSKVVGNTFFNVGDDEVLLDNTCENVLNDSKTSEELSELKTQKADKTITDALQKDKAPVIIDSAEGNPIVLTDGADGLPIEGMKIHFLPVQSGTGDPSPENVRPISGRTDLTAWRTGKNLIDDSKKSKSGSNIYIGTETANTPGIILPPGTYTVAFVITENLQRNLYARDADTGEGIPGFPSYQAYSTSPAVVTFTLTKQTRLVLWTYNTGYTGFSDVISVMLNSGNTAFPYTPYTGQSYPVTFPDGQTVYGGTWDAVNEVLTVEWVADTITKDSAWYGFSTGTGNSSAVVQLTNYQNVKYVEGSASYNGAISSVGKELQNYWVNARQNEATDDCGFAYSSGGQLRVHRSDVSTITDLASFKEAFPNMQICYQIATPIEIPLDPITIQTLLGDNTIWSDANGTIELDYRADTKLFITKNKQDIRATIAPIEDGTTASKAYSAGKFFYHDGQFCKAKTSIAAGATFTLNTNYQITTVADELFALN